LVSFWRTFSLLVFPTLDQNILYLESIDAHDRIKSQIAQR
jgi:hypothetical protein